MSIHEQRLRVEGEISSLVDNLDREVLRKMQVRRKITFFGFCFDFGILPDLTKFHFNF